MPNGQRPPPEGIEQFQTRGHVPGESLAAEIKRIAAEGKARLAENDARQRIADAFDARKIGDLEARKLLADVEQKRAEKAEKDKQSFKEKQAKAQGKPPPEPKDIMQPPSSLDSNDQRVQPSALPGGAVGGAGAQQVLSQLVGGEGPGAQQMPGQVGSTETTFGIQNIGGGVDETQPPLFAPTVEQRFRQRQLTPAEMQSAQFAKMQGQAGAPVPPSVAAGWRSFSPLSDPSAQTLGRISDDLARVKNSILQDGFEQHKDEWQEIQANYFDQGWIPIRDDKFFVADEFLVLQVPEIERKFVRARPGNAEERWLKEHNLWKEGNGEEQENHFILQMIAVNLARRLNGSAPQAEQAIQERKQRRDEEQQLVQEADQNFNTLVGQ